MKIKFFAAIISIFLILSFTSGCYKESGVGYTKLTKTLKQITPVTPNNENVAKQGYKNVAFELFNKLYYEAVINNSSSENNVTVSPLSFYLCASMLFNGAEGETLSQYENVVKSKISEANNYSSTLINKYLQTKFKNTQINLANSIWINEKNSNEINSDYLLESTNFYNADIYKADFSSNNSVKAVNNWVNYKTDNMIDKIIDSFDLENVMMFINAFYFNSKWQTPYKESKSALFTNKDGTTTTKEFLERDIYNCYANDIAKAFKMPFSDNFSFIGILPENANNFDEFAINFDAEKYNNLISSPITENYDGEVIMVKTAIPEMKLKFEIDLKKAMKNMGIVDAFNKYNANFSRITNNENNNLYVSSGKQKTVFELDKEGVKAAAVTNFGMDKATSIAPSDKIISIRLDRPFLFGIIDNETNLPLFFGSVQNF